MFWEQKILYAVLSDVGFRRQNNQDSCSVVLAPDRENWQARGHLFVVADGMGGHAVGELASKMAVDVIPHTFDKLREQHPVAALKTAIETANADINERGTLNRDFLRMGTTCTTLLLSPLGAVIGHVGDSRAYRIRRRQIDQLTRDHSLVWELIEQRKVHPRDADRLYPRNVITRSLGPEPQVKVDIEGPAPVYAGDIFVLCSDGLTTLVNDAEIGMIAAELPPADACRLLVNLANLRGGSDNITVIVVRAGEVPSNASAPEIPVRDDSGGGGWGTFVVWCTLAVLFLVGTGLLALTEHKLVGSIILGGTVLGGLIWWWKQPKREALYVEDYETGGQSTIIWRPYRTALAKLTPDFVHLLAKMEVELHHAAVDERWPIDLAQRDDAFRKTQQAMTEKQYGRALKECARAIDLMMAGVLWERKQTQKKPKPTDPNASTANPPAKPTSPPTPPPANRESPESASKS